MEKSIEKIWMEGFRNNNDLNVPRIQNPQERKSLHIIDKFRRMFRINLIAIVVGSFFFLVISYFMGMLITGVMFFILLMGLVIVNKKLLDGLDTIDKGESSYSYLKAFNQWIKMQVNINEYVARIIYPIFFVAIVLGFWFKEIDNITLGEKLVAKALSVFPNLYLVEGVPLIAMIACMAIAIFLAFAGARIYRWDVNVIYGRIFKKLDSLMKDVEELNA